MWYRWKNKRIYRRESADTDPHKQSQLTADKGAKATQWGEDSLFNKWCWETGHPQGKVSLDKEFTLFTEISSERITDPNVKHKNYKNSRRQYKRKPRWLWVWRWLFRNKKKLFICKQMIAKSWFMKETVGKLDISKMEHLCSAKCTVKRMRWTITDREKTFAKDTSDVRNVQRTLKHQQENSKHPFKKESQRP